MVKTLAIETSCDDTSVGIVDFDGQVFSVDSLLAYSQIDDHQKYWWVVPEIASRLHSDKIIEVIKNIGFDKIREVDCISVTIHPWLPGSLVVGKAVASLLSSYFAKPLVYVNHIYWHLFSLLLDRNISDIQFPMVVLTASGGHNDIYVVTNSEFKIQNAEWLERREFGWYKVAKVWYTLDDAAGECFDKVARMLGGPYPGGQRISEQALKSRKYQVSSIKTDNELRDPDFSGEQITNNESEASELHRDEWSVDDIKFKRIFLSKDNFEFSFSWMKSQVFFLLKQFEKNWKIKRLENWKLEIPEELICDIAYEFQEAVVEVMVKKLVRAGIAFDAKTLWLAGGVSCNDRLREYLEIYVKEKTPEVVVLKPVKKVYSMDNAAMIGLAGILEYNAEWIMKNEKWIIPLLLE